MRAIITVEDLVNEQSVDFGYGSGLIAARAVCEHGGGAAG
jgi:hypothetical protein